MRLLTWNINHRARLKAIPKRMVDAIDTLQPDLITLTEYVPGPSRENFIKDLANIGLENVCQSRFSPKQNHILIAANRRLQDRHLQPPQIAPSVPSNVLHVQLPDDGFEIIGLRLPDYSRQPRIRRAWWDWLLSLAASINSCPAVILGDFNTDPRYSAARCGDKIAKLIKDGWQLAKPAEGDSYWSPNGNAVRIDHAFVKGIIVKQAKYVTACNGYEYVDKGSMALSDHAVLVIDINSQENRI